MPTTVLPSSLLQPREDRDLRARFAISSAASDGLHTVKQFDSWFAKQKRASRLEVERIPFAELEGWSFAEDTGNLAHSSGSYFSIEGMRVLAWTGPICEWYQPVVNTPGVGIHGLLVKEFDGVLHCLVQARIEPGHAGILQLFPTVQAPRNAYARALRDQPASYLDHFSGPGRGRIVTDLLQSAHGPWFYRTSNRNMIVEVSGEVELHEGFIWLTVGQLNTLLLKPNVLSIGLRSLLSFVPPLVREGSTGDRFHQALVASSDADRGASRNTPEVLSWLTEQRSYREVEVSPAPLNKVAGWHRTESEIARADGKYFTVVAVAARSGTAAWSQPLIELRGRGVAAFVVREVDGVLHVLAKASMESGLRDSVELGPTVQCLPKEFDNATGRDRPFLLDYVLGMDRANVRYDVVHTGEGSRFLNAECRYLIVEADDKLPAEIPAELAWVTVGQLTDLLRHNHFINIQARTLISVLNALH